MMFMTLKVQYYNMFDVNEWVEVEHHTKSFGRRPMMLTYHWEWGKFPLMYARSKVLKGFTKSTS